MLVLVRRGNVGDVFDYRLLFIDEKATRPCHSERSAAESKNLRCLSQRKADMENSHAVITLGHDRCLGLAT